jgi:membrane protein YdbS with pleckstrin-like domain
MSRHPLLAFMCTPMAAPETARLRRLRFAWMGLCGLLAIGAVGIRFWVGLFGLWSAAAVALLLVATPVVGLVYFTAKTRADEAWALRSDAP